MNDGIEDANNAQKPSFMKEKFSFDTPKIETPKMDSTVPPKQPNASNVPVTEIEALNQKLEELTKKLAAFEETSQNPATAQKSGTSPEEIAAIVAQAFKVAATKEIDAQAGMSEEQIPKDDYDPIGTRFVCPQVGYILEDDIRKGQIVRLPFNMKPLVFEYVATRRTRTGKDNQTHPYSAYRSHSKRLTEWLMNHSFYGTRFFTNANEATTVDVQRAMRLADVMKSLQSYEYHELIKRCTERGISPGEDSRDMRTRLAVKIVTDEINSEAQKAHQSLEETYKTASLIGKEA